MAWFSKNKFWLTGAGLSILSVVVRFIAVDQTPHPSGWDGYYYVMQVHSWITFGYLQSPDFSLIYPYFTAIALITGDAVLAFKVGVALLSGALTATVYFRKKSGLIILISLYLIFSPLTTYFILQFPKNVLGLIFLILCLQSKNRVATFTFFVATILTHRMTGAFALISAGLFAAKQINWKWIVAGIIFITALSFLPGIIHISDLLRFNDQFTAIPHWAPYAFYRIFPNSLSWLFKLELILISIVIILLLVGRPKDLPWIAIAIISIFPFFKFSAGDVGHRFFLIAPVALIMLLPDVEWRPRIQWVVASLFLVAIVFSWKSYKPQNFDPPNNRYAYITGKLATRYDHHEYPLVVVHKSLAEMIIFKTDFDALNWLPPDDMPPQHVLRLINGVNYTDLRKHLDENDRSRLRSIASGYFALPEDAWQRFVVSVDSANDKDVRKRINSGRNPMDKKPYYLNKGKTR